MTHCATSSSLRQPLVGECGASSSSENGEETRSSLPPFAGASDREGPPRPPFRDYDAQANAGNLTLDTASSATAPLLLEPSSPSASPSSPPFLPYSHSSSHASSSVYPSWSFAYDGYVKERRRRMRMLWASVSVDTLLMVLVLAQEWRSWSYSVSHSLLDVALLHLCRSLVVILSVLRVRRRTASTVHPAPDAFSHVVDFDSEGGRQLAAPREKTPVAGAALEEGRQREDVSGISSAVSSYAELGERAEAVSRYRGVIRAVEEAEREAGEVATKGKSRIDTALRVIFVCLLAAVLKAINLRFEDILTDFSHTSSSPVYRRNPQETGAGLHLIASSGFHLLLPFLEVAWAVVAPFLQAYSLWRVRVCLSEERALLHRRLLQLLQLEKREAAACASQREASEQEPRELEAPADLQGSAEEDQEEIEDLSTVEFLKLLRPYFWPSGAVASRAEFTSQWNSPFVLRALALSTFLCIAVSKVLTLASPLLLGGAAGAAAEAARFAAEGRHDEATEAGRKGALFVAAFAGAALGAKLFKELQALAYLKVQQAAYVETSERTLRHLLSLPLEWHVKKQMGHVIRATDRGTEACSYLMTYLFLYLVPALFECIAVCLVFMFHLRHRVLASLLFLSLSIYAWVTLQVTFWRRKWREAQNQRDSKYHQLAIDALTNFETVKMFNAEDYEVRRYVGAVQEFQELGTKIQASLSFLNAAQQTIVYATLVGGLAFTVQAIAQGTMSVGEFVTVQMYLLNVFAPLNFLGTIYNVIVRSVADAQNLSHLLGTKPGIVDAPDAASLVDILTRPPSSPGVSFRDSTASTFQVSLGTTAPASALLASDASMPAPAQRRSQGEASDEAEPTEKNETQLERFYLQAPLRPLVAYAVGDASPPLPYAPSIEFENVCFSYNGQGRHRRSIRDVSINIPACKTCALVGISGSGKSTLTKLLMRLLEPDSGRVLINGVDVSRVTQESLRACIGMVPQEPVMFNATIYENIAYAKPNATFSEVEAAADAAQLLPLVLAMKDKWNTRVGERGLRLSGGERQRVAIARCFLRNPPIVLLDEATSSLDSVTEAAIQKGLLSLNSNRTVLMVAHRLSTIMHADLICVMRGGRVAEMGTHMDLLDRQGLYAELWEAQAKQESRESEEETEAEREEKDEGKDDSATRQPNAATEG
ncbi:ABC transporter transmembrane region domain-containing protein [Toxoplasma gondii VAND]|uniref:ABC transporter transmembrane region domain-containing protein n=1 Tax=Toxoplasma gondii VAND TaxID=933077 RepID=A0A086QGC8_TOXGO|nr:ABC transporter transmembrane region domain-containing protein [Toxoplasma gondii VAND]